MTPQSPTLAKFKIDTIANVAADLRALAQAADLHATQHSLRQTSALVRLIADGSFRDAWHFVGVEGQPMIPCQSFAPGYNAQFAFIGGATFNAFDLDGTHYGGVRMAMQGPSGELIDVTPKVSGTEFLEINGNTGSQIGRYGNAALVDHSLKLDYFFSDTVMIVENTRISRRDIIKYIANRRGGAHLKSGGGKHKTEAVFDTLDMLPRLKWQTPVSPFELPFYSLMTIVRNLTDASDTARFLETVEARGIR